MLASILLGYRFSLRGTVVHSRLRMSDDDDMADFKEPK